MTFGDIGSRRIVNLKLFVEVFRIEKKFCVEFRVKGVTNRLLRGEGT